MLSRLKNLMRLSTLQFSTSILIHKMGCILCSNHSSSGRGVEMELSIMFYFFSCGCYILLQLFLVRANRDVTNSIDSVLSGLILSSFLKVIFIFMILWVLWLYSLLVVIFSFGLVFSFRTIRLVLFQRWNFCQDSLIFELGSFVLLTRVLNWLSQANQRYYYCFVCFVLYFISYLFDFSGCF